MSFSLEATYHMVELTNVMKAVNRFLTDLEEDVKGGPPLVHDHVRSLELACIMLTGVLSNQLKTLPILLCVINEDAVPFVLELDHFTRRLIRFLGRPDTLGLGEISQHRDSLCELSVKLRELLPEGGWYE